MLSRRCELNHQMWPNACHVCLFGLMSICTGSGCWDAKASVCVCAQMSHFSERLRFNEIVAHHASIIRFGRVYTKPFSIRGHSRRRKVCVCVRIEFESFSLSAIILEWFIGSRHKILPTITLLQRYVRSQSRRWRGTHALYSRSAVFFAPRAPDNPNEYCCQFSARSASRVFRQWNRSPYAARAQQEQKSTHRAVFYVRAIVSKQFLGLFDRDR